MLATETTLGWKIEISPREGGESRDTISFPTLSEAIDEAMHQKVNPPHRIISLVPLDPASCGKAPARGGHTGAFLG
jgi:hypothetical protein